MWTDRRSSPARERARDLPAVLGGRLLSDRSRSPGSAASIVSCVPVATDGPSAGARAELRETGYHSTRKGVCKQTSMSRFQIVSRRALAPAVTLLEVTAPRVARRARAGQFVIIRVDEQGERIPLTIADRDPEKGTVTIVFQAVGYSTRQLSEKEVGESIADLLGPLGRPTEVTKLGRVVCVAGGVGIAFIYPEIKAFAEAGNEVISILAARTKDLLFFVEEIRALSKDLHIATDDGSLGRHGLVTDVLRGLLESGQHFDYCIAIGPLPMMRATTALTKEFDLPTLVSLDPIMVDGTGMCGGCRVTVGGEVKFACVDGPEFDGHLVDFDELAKRKRAFFDEEQCLLEQQAEQLERHGSAE